MKLINALRVYEALREPLGPDWTRDLVVKHYEMGSISYSEREEVIVGVAFSWHISDPYDVELYRGYPGEDPNGRYLYFPMIWVHDDHRSGSLDTGVVSELILKSFQRAPSATRMAFIKEYNGREKLKIIRFDRHGRQKAIYATK